MEEVEIWRNIGVVRGIDFTGYYEVSRFGNVRSIDRWVHLKNGGKKFVYGSDVSKQEDKDGYLKVCLCYNGREITVPIHRLVALSFIPNPSNLPCVNHKDENKKNNDVNNLEWCDYKYNNNYGTRLQKVLDKESIPVVQLSMNGEFIKEWPSMMSIQENENFSESSLAVCLSKKRYVHGGFIWIKSEQYNSMNEDDIKDFVNSINSKRKGKPTKIIRINKDTGERTVYNSMLEAARKNDCSISCISRCAKEKRMSRTGFMWECFDYCETCETLELNGVVETDIEK